MTYTEENAFSVKVCCQCSPLHKAPVVVGDRLLFFRSGTVGKIMNKNQNKDLQIARSRSMYLCLESSAEQLLTVKLIHHHTGCQKS